MADINVTLAESDINVTFSNAETIATTITLAGVAIVPNSTQVTTDTTNFNNNLSTADTTVQKALDTIDDLALAPTNATYVTISANATLSTERVLTAGPNITFADGGINSTLTIEAWSGTGSSTTLAGLTDVTIDTPATNQMLIYSGTEWSNHNLVLDTMVSPNADILLSAIGVSFTNNSAVFSSGTTVSLSVPYNCSIMQWDALSLSSGTFVADVKKSVYADYPSMTSIAGTDKPTLAGNAYKGTSTTLTGWTLAVTAGDVLKFDIEQAIQSGTITAQLKVRKT